jgi:hypothetical protein
MMIISHPTKRRVARVVTRTATIASAVGLGITIWGMSLSGVPVASAVAVEGSAQVVAPLDGNPGAGDPLTAGGSLTSFSLRLPSGAACSGDSANDDYRVQSYMVPSSVNPGSLTFDASGPIPNGLGAAFGQPLYTPLGSSFVNGQTASATPPPGPGPVVNIPAFDFGVFEPGHILPGTFNLGIACTVGSASATQLDKFWNVQMTFTTDAADQPAGVAWTVSQTPATTTTTAAGSTTSTTAGGTTTTIDGSTTTTFIDDSTTTTLALGDTGFGGSPTGTSVAGVTSLPVTGSSPMALVVWSALLLVFGRMTVLLARPPRIRPATP